MLKAGIMKDVNGSVSADPRKGWLVVTREDDELLRLYWKERKETEFDHQGQALLLEESAEECLVLFPEDAELIHLRDKPGRIFLLKFHTSAKRVFFWMQESSAEHDESNCSKINSLISGLFSTDDDDTNNVINAANSVDAMLIDAGVAEASPSSSSGTRKSFSQLLDMKKVVDFVKQNPDIHDDLKKLLPEEIDFDASAIERVVRGPFFRQVHEFKFILIYCTTPLQPSKIDFSSL